MQFLGAGVGGLAGGGGALVDGMPTLFVCPLSFKGKFSYICRGRSSGGLGKSWTLLILALATVFSIGLHSLYLMFVYSLPNWRLFCNKIKHLVIIRQ